MIKLVNKQKIIETIWVNQSRKLQLTPAPTKRNSGSERPTPRLRSLMEISTNRKRSMQWWRTLTWMRICSSMLSTVSGLPSNSAVFLTTSQRSSRQSLTQCTCRHGTASWAADSAPTWPTRASASFSCTGARSEFSSGELRTNLPISTTAVSSDFRLHTT